QEADIVVAPCRGFQPAEATLAELLSHALPVVAFAISEPQLSPSDQTELREIRDKFSLPIFFLRVGEADTSSKDKASLRQQLLELRYLPGDGCRASSVLAERLRPLGAFCRQVLQKHLVEAATRLSEVHGRCLDVFINQAFDMQRDLQITPKRLEYTRRKEGELYESLLGMARRKQEEMKELIVDTLAGMKEELLEEAAAMEFRDILILPGSGEPGSSRDVQRCIRQIQELIIARLNQAVASKLSGSVQYLRESCVGTLERCLRSLEESWEGAGHPARGRDGGHITSNYLKQPRLADSPCLAPSRQIIQRLTWVSPPAITGEWKRKVAQDAIESLSASKLAKSICSQFRTRLNSSHEAFAASLRQVRA
ncbi:DUSTY kinase, partial [Donacobius atricapilla]|nr:DUSTY kinase [Donacobius atricapilla]